MGHLLRFVERPIINLDETFSSKVAHPLDYLMSFDALFDQQ